VADKLNGLVQSVQFKLLLAALSCACVSAHCWTCCADFVFLWYVLAYIETSIVLVSVTQNFV